MKYWRTIGWALVMLICAPHAFAHRSGCHAWRTCPSDRGTYGSPATGNVAAAEAHSVSRSAKTSRRYELIGRVIGVADGDTITVLGSNQAQHKIRLAGIDAPEKSQAYGTVSKQHLSALVFGQNVTVAYDKTDRYGRTVGTVLGNRRDVNLEQVKAGLAWHYKKYQSEQTPKHRAAYAQAELNARKNRWGLWRDLHPIPPWEFRRKRR
ncbi:MAG: thermonuclease family protein [Nitrososphaera sp.]|nr:thermonuclease family protein [Nitrososphaera sp.]